MSVVHAPSGARPDRSTAAHTDSTFTAGAVPSYAAPLAGGAWRVWRRAALRGAGFAASHVLSLAGTAATAAADALLDSRVEVERLKSAALDELRSAPEAAGRAGRAWRALVARQLARDEIPSGLSEGRAAALARALDAHKATRAALEAAHETDIAAAERQLHALFSQPRFREAVLWQNHASLERTLRQIEHAGPRDFRRRGATHLLAMHLQRYAVKNESIGFFGPVGWASVVDEPCTIEAAYGDDVVCRREVYFEGWCIDALAEALDREPGIRRWTSPRCKAGVWIDGDRVYPPGGEVETTAEERAALRACDGERTAIEVVELLTEGRSDAEAEAATFALLDRLVARGLLAWRLEVRPQLHPERELEARIAKIGDTGLRATCRAALDALVSARDRVAAAAGDPDRLAVRMEELGTAFTRLTGQPPSRRAGSTYGARGLVYEDCRRACDVALGTAFLHRIGSPLSIVLDGARWVYSEIRARAAEYLRQRHAELRARDGVEEPDAFRFIHFVREDGRNPVEAIVADVSRRFQERWQAVLGADMAAARVALPIDGVRERAQEAFRIAEGMECAEYFSPDLMIGAASLDAFRRGEFHAVLGEIHSRASILSSSLHSQQPDPEWIASALTEDAGGDMRLVVQPPKHHWLARSNVGALPATAWRCGYGDDPPALPDCRVAPAGLLVAVDDGAGVRLRARDGSVEFDAFDIFRTEIATEIDSVVGDWLPASSHLPRVTIADLTLSREQWRLTPNEMPFLAEGGRALQFALLRAWARERGMPRHMFYKSPVERKPCYLDLDSPMYVEVFVRLMRRLEPSASVRISEMMPGLDDLWLSDRDGTRYTSEFRIIARRPA